MDEFEQLLAQPDAVLRVQTASAAMETHRRAISRLAAIRARALVELRQGQSVAAIAEQLGISRQQVHRLLREALGRGHQAEGEP